jgi:hypothetical protein
MIKKGKKIITVIPFSQSKETQLEVAHSWTKTYGEY